MAEMKFKVQLLDGLAVRRALTRLSFEIVEKSADLSNVVLVGIKTRGVPIAETIAANIEANSGVRVPTCALDITFYRDDLSKVADMPQVEKPSFDIDINGREVVLVDDVLYTGRTARAAIDALFSVGRPSRIRLAVLVDRGHRELPIRPDYIGKNVPTSLREVVRVNFEATDGKTNVELYEREEN
jgi:pyrimidine operon attenuation protein/uracil phosphoribosyltransferase